jgi:hypothetical protein
MAFIVDRRGMSGTNVPSPPAIVICTQILFYFSQEETGQAWNREIFFTCKQGRIQDQGAPETAAFRRLRFAQLPRIFYLHGARARQPGAEAVRHGNDDDKNRNEQTRHRYKKGKG